MLLALNIELSDRWTSDHGPTAQQQSQIFVSAGISPERVHQYVHADDEAWLTIYRLRGAKRQALDEVSAALVRDIGAGRLPNGLVWMFTGPDWLSFNAIQEGREVSGPALLWSSYLPKATAQDRMREISAAMGTANWTL